jgi:hypothetical protein
MRFGWMSARSSGSTPAPARKTLFLDIPASQFAGGGERGVLGLAFHPDYAANGRFFVFLTQPSGDIEVREYARSGGDPTLADPAPVSTIITIPHPIFSNHNGGSLALARTVISMFPLAMGEGPTTQWQRPESRRPARQDTSGSTSTMTIFRADAARTYAIPADNPFVGASRARMKSGPGACASLAHQLRFTDRRPLYRRRRPGFARGVDLSAGDRAAINYGWDYREGTLPGPSAPARPADRLHRAGLSTILATSAGP